MGSSHSKTPEEVYRHCVEASTSLFKSVSQHWIKTSRRYSNTSSASAASSERKSSISSIDSPIVAAFVPLSSSSSSSPQTVVTKVEEQKLIQFFANFRYAVTTGEIEINDSIHRGEEFTEYILKRCGNKELLSPFQSFKNIEQVIIPDKIKAHIIAAWVRADEEHQGELSFQTIYDKILDQNHLSKFAEEIALALRERLEQLRIKMEKTHQHHHNSNNNNNNVSSHEYVVSFTTVSDLLDQIHLWHELDIYWRANFASHKESLNKGNFLTQFEVEKFLQQYQHEGNARERSKILEAACGGTFDRHAFLRYLADPKLNPIVDYERQNSVYHDMTHPLSSYFISASFRTYLNRDIGAHLIHPENINKNKKVSPSTSGSTTPQRRGSSGILPEHKQWLDNMNIDHHNPHVTNNINICNVEKYKQVLLLGCRCIDLDIWENSDPAGDHQFVVGPDFTNNDNIPLSECLETISKYAFETSEFPVIIIVNVYCSEELQKLVAIQIRKQLGEEHIFFGSPSSSSSQKNNNNSSSSTVEPQDWSPQTLKRKFVLAGRSETGSGANEPPSAAAAGYASTAGGRRHEHAHTHTHWRGIAKELVDLFFIHHFQVHSVNDLLDQKNSSPTSSSSSPSRIETANYRPDDARNAEVMPTRTCGLRSLSDDTALAYAASHARAVARSSLSNFVRVFPTGPRWKKSENFYPITPWDAGMQMLSMHWVHFHSDEALRLYRARFRDNGNCGYLLRPHTLMGPLLIPHADGGPAPPRSQFFEFSVLSAFGLPVPKQHLFEGERVNAFVAVRIEGPGHPPNRLALKTLTIPNSGHHPVWFDHVTEEERQLKQLQRFNGLLNAEQVQKDEKEMKRLLREHQVVTSHSSHPYHSDHRDDTSSVDDGSGSEAGGDSHVDDAARHARTNMAANSHPERCSVKVEVAIPEMSQIVVQVYHSRKVGVNRIHDYEKAETITHAFGAVAAGGMIDETVVDPMQLESEGKLKDVLLAEAFLPVHLLHRGVRSVRLTCRETGSEESVMMCKIAPASFADDAGALEENFSL